MSLGSMKKKLLWPSPVAREALLLVIFFFLATCFLTNWVILHVNSQLFTAGIGDGTSGFLWLLYADKGWNYFNTHTTLINFPYGESLWSPVYITWTLIMGPLWLLSRFLSPIASMNIMMFVGFMSGGILMYYLLKRLTHKWAISLLGGYAVAFVSYHIMKGVDHFTNIFAWVFVAIIGTFVAFWRKPTILRGIFLAGSVAAACYTDGYYIFVSAVLIFALVISGLLVDFLAKVPLKTVALKTMKLTAVGGVALVLMTPIALTQVAANKQITTDLSNSRDNVKKEISYYSSLPIDFLLPVSKNITVSQYSWYQQLLAEKDSRSNDGENSTYIGYVVLGLSLLGVAYGVRSVRSTRRTGRELQLHEYTLLVTLLAAPLVLIWMLQPEIQVLGLKIFLPTEILVKYVPYWRVPSRLFVALHPVLVVAACLSLAELTRAWSRRHSYVFVSILFLIVGTEYYTNVKRPSFGLADMPQTYTWLSHQSYIHSIAELPLVDRPIEIAGYAVFAQLIHGKSLVNSSLSKAPVGLLNPLGMDQEGETIRFLQDRHVDAVLIHDVSCYQHSWGTLIHQEYHVYSPPFTDPHATALCTYRLNANTDQRTDYYIYAGQGFAQVDSVNGEAYNLHITGTSTSMMLVDAQGSRKPISKGNLHLTGTLYNINRDWKLLQNGSVLAAGGPAQEKLIDVTVTTTSPIQLNFSGIPDGNAQLGNLKVF